MWVMNLLIVVLTVVGMEITANLVHRFVMHGVGWGWHQSHHEVQPGIFEKNDLYAVVFSAGALLLLWVSRSIYPPLQPVGLGVTLYGILYFVVHDGLVHRRWPFRHHPRHPYLRRLVQAHRLHHATHGRDGAVSFGFLYARPVAELVSILRQSGHLRPDGVEESGSDRSDRGGEEGRE